jgi:hypothetical protein
VTADLPLRYYRALADLPHDRERALAALEACFVEGATPADLEGPLDGRLLTTTLGFGLDALAMGLARVWMPWKGKSFAPASSDGRNLFTPGFRLVLRLLWPGYHDARDEPGRLSAFRFTTWEGESALASGVKVLKIDYGHEGSPALLIRPILDELVAIGDGLHLGQALMRWGGDHRRVAWFQLAEPGAG